MCSRALGWMDCGPSPSACGIADRRAEQCSTNRRSRRRHGHHRQEWPRHRCKACRFPPRCADSASSQHLPLIGLGYFLSKKKIVFRNLQVELRFFSRSRVRRLIRAEFFFARRLCAASSCGQRRSRKGAELISCAGTSPRRSIPSAKST
jgi:hypothetical protein